ncbi:MAG: 50S ribosomal protein L23 [Oscillospiraceae bacterium]|jgi:large subunit ribosomal protein L23|nr:50S ribosomal protein L23 [Oscillospiraceae bacterium]
MESYDIILRPIISEKSTLAVSDQKYSFEVDRRAGKIEIRRAVEEVFGVKVASVNTMNIRGKMRRRGRVFGFTPARKKAIVTLRKGENSIEFFDGV